MAKPAALLDPGRGAPCANASHTAILRSYPAPQGRPGAEEGSVPLRCGMPDRRGRGGWGYRHMSDRWAGFGVAERFDRDIASSLVLGRRARIDRATVRYDHGWVDHRGAIERAMTVIVSLRSQQPDTGIRGIVTAYWWDHPERASRLLPGGRR